MYYYCKYLKRKKKYSKKYLQFKEGKKKIREKNNYLKYKIKKKIQSLNKIKIINTITKEEPSSNSSSEDSDIETFLNQKKNNYNNYCQDISSSEDSIESISDDNMSEEINNGNFSKDNIILLDINNDKPLENNIGTDSEKTSNDYNSEENIDDLQITTNKQDNCVTDSEKSSNDCNSEENLVELQSTTNKEEMSNGNPKGENIIMNIVDKKDKGYCSDSSDDIECINQIINSLT